jgi:hypothetical protein
MAVSNAAESGTTGDNKAIFFIRQDGIIAIAIQDY